MQVRLVFPQNIFNANALECKIRSKVERLLHWTHWQTTHKLVKPGSTGTIRESTLEFFQNFFHDYSTVAWVSSLFLWPEWPNLIQYLLQRHKTADQISRMCRIWRVVQRKISSYKISSGHIKLNWNHTNKRCCGVARNCGTMWVCSNYLACKFETGSVMSFCSGGRFSESWVVALAHQVFQPSSFKDFQ